MKLLTKQYTQTSAPNTITNKLSCKSHTKALAAFVMTMLTSACMSTDPQMGNSSGNTVTGGVGGANSANQNSGLENCEAPLGTLSVFEDTKLTWWRDYRTRYPKLGSTIPVIRLMIQQSNCFVVVERGRAMNAMNRERELMQSGQLRSGSNVGGGQMVAADYTISPEIQFAEKGTEGYKAIGGAIFGSIGSLIGGGMNKNEAATTLILIDNRSGVQVSAAVGSAGNYDYDVFGGLFVGGLAGGSAYSKTPEGKVISAAFADSYNQMVIALRNYKAQEVKGGLGKGGQLKVGGTYDTTPKATTNASIPTNVPQASAPIVRTSYTTSTKKHYDFEVDEYDERALKKYYDSLKNASTFTSGLAAYSSASVNTEHRDMAMMAMNMFTSQLEASKIELESWPLSAKQEAWRVLGAKIKKYNSLFEKHRTIALKNKDIEPSVTDLLRGINLITEQSLFGS